MAEKSEVPKPTKHLWLTLNTDHGMFLALRPAKQPGSNTLSSPVQIRLVPGANIVERAPWEKWKSENQDNEFGEGEATRMLKGAIPEDNHRNRRQERAGRVFIVEGAPIENKANPLFGMEEGKARAFVPEIRDERMLRELLVIERRPAVIEALRAEIDKHVRGGVRPAA